MHLSVCEWVTFVISQRVVLPKLCILVNTLSEKWIKQKNCGLVFTHQRVHRSGLRLKRLRDTIPKWLRSSEAFLKIEANLQMFSTLSQRQNFGQNFWPRVQRKTILNSDNFKIGKGQIFRASPNCVFVSQSLLSADFKGVSCSLRQCLARALGNAVWVPLPNIC